jgi:imidazolonepropionase-like amidohydrolase
MKRLHLPAAGLALILAGCGGAAPEDGAAPAEAGALALVGAQLIDATGAPPVADSVVVVRDGRIVSAGPRDTTPVPAGAETLDVTGKTIMPGLVNLHVHYREGPEEIERQFRSQLHYGVTTARSIGSDSPERVAHLLESAGRPDAPRTYTAGLGFSYPGGFNAAGRNAPTTEEEARELVRNQIALGVHFIKMWVNAVAEPGLKIPPEIRAAIIDEAVQNGAIPVAHIDDEADGRQLVEAGLRDFLHSTVLTFGPGAGVPVDDPDPSPEFIRMCLDNGAYFTPTLSIVQNRWHFAEHPELLEDPALRAAFNLYNPDALARLDDPASRAEIVDDPGFEDRKAAFRQVQDFVKTMHDAGVAVALGNDAGTPNVPFGWGMHHEMELYVEAGLTPMDAIVAATATGAAQMPPVGETDFGTLEAGNVADLVVLNADPLADIGNTLEIDRVMRLGEWVDRSGLLPAP